mmetsp:Transcript_90593/g.110894  ORF Transcript_90593/g.110894 Transcript_90593/m.110894 type:complete len:244 (-) Transcript_90593:20-751(-)
MGNKGSKGGIMKQRDLKESVDMLVHGYVCNNYDMYVPDSIIDIITQFHGIYNINFDSNIIPDNKVLLMEMILCKELNNNDIQLNRIYSGKMDGFTSKIYHQKVDDKGANITIIKNEFNTIFGGYTQVGWTQEWKCFHDKSAFLYQLFPNKRVILQKRDDGHKAVFHKKPYMCGFSGQCDLVIKDECDKRANSYVFPRHYQFNDPTMLCGGKNTNKNVESSDDPWENDQMHFLVKDIEVFQVIS